MVDDKRNGSAQNVGEQLQVHEERERDEDLKDCITNQQSTR